MHDETIPAPLMHREDRRKPEALVGSGLLLKVIAVGIIALYVIAPLLR
jgi:hypothetical protein